MRNKYECTYCRTLFVEPDSGAIECPNCHGPGPKKIEDLVYERIIVEYRHVQSGPSAYYRHPSPSGTEWLYDTLGYKIVVGIYAIGALVLTALFLYMWFFYRTGAPKDTDPRYQNIIPSAVATVTPYHPYNPWENTVWLSTKEALALRTQENAINLAYLDRGGAKYTNQSVIFVAESWQMVKPLGVTEKTVNGTAVKLKINGDEYHLNTYQPFVIKGQESILYLVDTNGQIWSTSLSENALVDLETAQNSLPVVINPNTKLSPTY